MLPFRTLVVDVMKVRVHATDCCWETGNRVPMRLKLHFHAVSASFDPVNRRNLVHNVYLL